jgi:solute carrier family 25 carnitine/acylcarnitine transporter 20/29
MEVKFFSIRKRGVSTYSALKKVYFASYEIMSRALATESDEEAESGHFSLGLLAAGGLAGVIGWGSTYPFDVAKTRIQSGIFLIIAVTLLWQRESSSVTAENQSNPAYKGVFRTFNTMHRQSGGYRVFFSGLGATTLRAFPTYACTFYTVLWVKKYLDDN